MVPSRRLTALHQSRDCHCELSVAFLHTGRGGGRAKLMRRPIRRMMIACQSPVAAGERPPVTAPDGTVTAPDGTATAPEGTVTAPEGAVTAPEGGMSAAPEVGNLQSISLPASVAVHMWRVADRMAGSKADIVSQTGADHCLSGNRQTWYWHDTSR